MSQWVMAGPLLASWNSGYNGLIGIRPDGLASATEQRESEPQTSGRPLLPWTGLRFSRTGVLPSFGSFQLCSCLPFVRIQSMNSTAIQYKHVRSLHLSTVVGVVSPLPGHSGVSRRVQPFVLPQMRPPWLQAAAVRPENPATPMRRW
jgi:hypothetical protein